MSRTRKPRPGARVRPPRRAVIRDYRAGDGTVAIGRRYGVSPSTVLRCLREWGERIRPPGNSTQRRMARVGRLSGVANALIDDVDVVRDEDGFRAVALSGGAVVARTSPQGSRGAALAEAVERWGV